MGLDGIPVDSYSRHPDRVDITTCAMEFSFILGQAVKASDTLKLGGVEEFAVRAERLVLGTPEVPIGAYSDRILAAAGREYGAELEATVRGHVASRELDVRRVLGRVIERDADAAIVYQSDATFAGDAVRAMDWASDR